MTLLEQLKSLHQELIKLRPPYTRTMQEARRKWVTLTSSEENRAKIIAALEEVERLREALRTIEADCEADYPPSHGAIKYACRAALGEQP